MPDAGLSVEVVRAVRGSVATTRTTLTRALRDTGFEILSEHTTLVRAQRGNQLAGAVSKDKLPVLAELTLTPEGAGCQVRIRISDRWRTPIGRPRGMQTLYEQTFADVLTALDAALPADQVQGDRSRPGPAADGPAGLLDRANSSLVGAASSLVRAADRKLQGGTKAGTPGAWSGVRLVRLSLDEEELLLVRTEVESVLGVAVLIGAQPGSLPPKLVQHVERLATTIEAALSSGAAEPVVALTGRDRPAVEFLRQQAALREALPARRLLICRDCRFEKVVNEDYQRLAERNRKLTALMGGLGATIRPGSISPFLVLGQLVRAKNLAPDFVCPRCQGMDADPFAITFCPSCGARHKASALRLCECGFDFRAEGAKLLAARPPLTAPIPTLPAPAAPALPAPAPAASVAGPSTPAAVPVSLAQAPRAPVFGAPSPSPSPEAVVPPVVPARPAPAAPTAAARTMPLPPPGWHPDPWRRAALRWWDGRAWTGHTHHG